VTSGGLRGAGRGGTLGAVLASLLILVPAVSRLDAYEISDPLIFMGLPLLAIATAVGALVGAALGANRRPTRGNHYARAGPSVPSGVFFTAAAVVIVGWLLVLATTTGILTRFGA
jgi:hypothetical protein